MNLTEGRNLDSGWRWRSMRILNGQCATLSTNNCMHQNTQSSDRGKRAMGANPSNQRDQLLRDVGRSSKSAH